MGGVNGLIPSEESAQDWAKMIPLEVVGPWRFVRGGGWLMEANLAVELRRAELLKLALGGEDGLCLICLADRFLHEEAFGKRHAPNQKGNLERERRCG